MLLAHLEPVRVAAWNLNHRTREKAIRPGTLEVMGDVDADVWVLTEFVDGESRAGFYDGLDRLGLRHRSSTEKVDGQNQVLVASRHHHVPGGLAPPDHTMAAATNFSHRLFPALGIEVAGVRPPAYPKASDLTAYWNQLAARISSTVGRPIVFIGDLNCDLVAGHGVGSRILGSTDLTGFTIPGPTGDWSYISTDGSKKSRIDHAIVAERIGATGARYIYEAAGHAVAGANCLDPVSDHAILALELVLSS
jgi:hypothetical protein